MPVDQQQEPIELWDLIRDVLARRAAGEQLPDAVVEAAHPTLMPKLRVLLRRAAKIEAVRNAASFDEDESEPEKKSSDFADIEFPRAFGEYTLVELVSIGGMGTVYRAIQPGTGRTVALKMIRDQQLADHAAFARFEREAKAASKLEHPNIVTVYEVGCIQGYHFISMQFVDGMNLEELIASGPIRGQRAAEIMVTIADALQKAHEHGVIHRDIKPSNILIDRDGVPYLTDFGLARELNSDNRVTQSGSLVGSPSYMAPEQTTGSPETIGIRSDVYSLGTVLYEMLVQRPPFVGASVPLTLLQVLNEPPLRPRRLNPDLALDLETICLKCLEKKPARRYPNPGEFGEDLRRWLDGHPIKARATTRLEHVVRWAKREKRLAFALCVATILLIALIAALVSRTIVTEKLLTRENAARLVADRNRQLLEKSLYISDMNRAQNALDNGDLNYLTILLEKYRTPPGAEHRSFEWYHLWRRNNFARKELVSIDQAIFAIDASADGQMLVVGGAMDEVHVYSSDPFAKIASLSGHTADILSVAVAPELRYIATASKDWKVRIYETERWSLKHEITAHEGAVHDVVFTHDGNNLISTGSDGNVRLWSTEDGTQQGSFIGHQDQVHAVALSPNGRTMVTGARDQSIRFWDLETQTLKEIVRIDCPAVRDVAYSPNGELVVAGTSEGDLHIYDAQAKRFVQSVKPHRAPIASVDFSPTGDSLASVGEDGKLCITDTSTWTIAGRFSGHRDRVYGVAHGKTRDRVYTVGWDGSFRLWQTNRKFDEVLRGHTWTVWEMDFTADGRYLVSASADQRIIVWDTKTLETVREVVGHEDEVNTICVTPDSRYIVSGSDDKTVRIWDFETGEAIHILEEHADDLTAVDLDPTGRTCISIGQDGKALKWDIETGRLLQHLDAEVGLTSLAIHPSGSYFVVGDRSGRLLVYNLDDFTFRHEVPAHSNQAISLRFSRDGTRLASGGRDSRLLIFDAQTFQQLHDIEADITFVASISFAPDGRTVATGGGDSYVKLWDVETGKQRCQFSEHESRVYSVKFSPDGNMLVSGSRGAAIYLRRIEPFE